MSTRADFYIGRGSDALWLGSIAADGYPEDKFGNGVPMPILASRNERDYRSAVNKLIRGIPHGTLPETGWPWPWDSSRLTDYAYAWDAWMVWRSRFGSIWMPATAQPHVDASDAEKDDFGHSTEKVEFPDMGSRRDVAPLGSPASGVIALGYTEP